MLIIITSTNQKENNMPVIYDDGSFTNRDYLAPTVYKKAGIQINAGVNYYDNLAYAVTKYYFLTNNGGADVDPAGQITFEPNDTAQTIGINVDFYGYDSENSQWQIVSYGYLKGLIFSLPPTVFRFYAVDGSGPFYAILDPSYMGISATSISSVDPSRLLALDALYREVQLMKYKYNALAGFLNTLAQNTLNPFEQQIFNEGVLQLQSLQAQMGNLQGIEITYTGKGAVIGLIPFLIIAIVAILAVATAWTIATINEQTQKTKQINDSFQLEEWVGSKKQELAAQVTAGTITQAQADDINKYLDGAASAANKIATTAAKNSEGTLQALGNIIKWAGITFLGFKLFQVVSPMLNKKSNA
jgi:large-conductance mechanosensitive channel